MAVTCVVDKKNLGPSLCKDLPQMLKGMITTPLSFSFSAANSVLSAQWAAALIADPSVRIHKWPGFKEFTDQSEKSVYEQNALTDNFVRNGKYIFEFGIIESLCIHKKMFTHNGNNQRVFLIDIKNNIYGTVDSSGNFMGFTISLLNLENILISNGQVSSKSPVKLVLLDNEELNTNGSKVDGSAFVNSLNELIDVNITKVASAAGSFSFTVKTDCDGTSVAGFVIGDFVFTKADGTTVALTALSYANGVYTITQVGNLFVALGNMNLKPVNTPLTITLYESTGGALY